MNWQYILELIEKNPGDMTALSMFNRAFCLAMGWQELFYDDGVEIISPRGEKTVFRMKISEIWSIHERRIAQPYVLDYRLMLKALQDTGYQAAVFNESNVFIAKINGINKQGQSVFRHEDPRMAIFGALMQLKYNVIIK